MKYMLLIYLDEQIRPTTEREHCYVESTQLATSSTRRAVSGANPLHPTATATSVRVRDGNPLVTDGPFAETREQLGGYFLIDAEDLDEAIGIAARIPGHAWHRRDPPGHGISGPAGGLISAAGASRRQNSHVSHARPAQFAKE